MKKRLASASHFFILDAQAKTRKAQRCEERL